MSEQIDKLSLGTRLKLRWYLLLRRVLHLWVKAKVLSDADGETGVPAGRVVCYVLSDYALSSILILDQACEELNIARPLLPIHSMGRSEPRAYAVLRRLKGLLIRRPSTRRSSETLGRLVEYSYAHPDQEIVLVPVTVLVGRAPDTETGVAKVLFAENWEVAGRFRRLMSTLINGRDTVIQFSRPISLQEMAAEDIGAARTLRKVSRILRTHFRRVRASVIGPDLSHRRTLMDAVVQSPAVRAAITDKARRDGIPEYKAADLARKYAREIAANYSYSFVRIAYFFIHWFLNKVFDEIDVRNFDRFRAQAPEFEVIYVPCHRSHADYLLISYLLYVRGFAVPHIAAGVNLNLPVVGSLIRRGGAFFLRRSFRSQALYSAVFSEYVSTILSQGVSIEYFIEGTRSRTGRLLPPKGGMLAMTVRAYLSAPRRPVMFQPIYIGYEQMLEGKAYTYELSGGAKKKETIGDLFRSLRLLSRHYGTPHVSFGEPIFLDDLLEACDPNWKKSSQESDGKPCWLTPLVNQLGDSIMRAINASADVNPVNLLALVLLAMPKHALGERELLAQIGLYKAMLAGGPYGEQISITAMEPAEIVEHGMKLGLLRRTGHTLGDILRVAPEHAIGLTYYRNNSQHLVATPSLIASCFLRRRSIPYEQLRRLAMDTLPFLCAELYLPWSEAQFQYVLDRNLDVLEAHGLLSRSEDGKLIRRAEGGTDAAAQLNLIARTLLPTLERYYITLAVLAKNGSGTLDRQQLEQLCMLTAQRISMLHEFEAPEFYDRGLFRQFIGELRRREVLVGTEDGKLEFGERIDHVVEDARFFLEKEIRHSITQVAPQALADNPDATG